jgi:hypothetical protein
VGLTNLSGANLSGAIGLTDEQMTSAWSLEGATMPNGQKYEPKHSPKNDQARGIITPFNASGLILVWHLDTGFFACHRQPPVQIEH